MFFFLVPDVVTADLVGALSRQPSTRVLLEASAPPLKNWLLQLASKQAQWEKAANKLLENSTANKKDMLAAILRRKPSFRVHVIVVLPALLEDIDGKLNHNVWEHPDTIGICEKFTTEVTSNVLWPRIRKNILQLKDMRATYPYNKSSSRLCVWLMPLNYIEFCYKASQLVEGDELSKYALEYEDNYTTFRRVNDMKTSFDVSEHQIQDSTVNFQSSTPEPTIEIIKSRSPSPILRNNTPDSSAAATDVSSGQESLESNAFENRKIISLKKRPLYDKKDDELITPNVNNLRAKRRCSSQTTSTTCSEDDSIPHRSSVRLKSNKKNFINNDEYVWY